MRAGRDGLLRSALATAPRPLPGRARELARRLLDALPLVTHLLAPCR